MGFARGPAANGLRAEGEQLRQWRNVAPAASAASAGDVATTAAVRGGRTKEAGNDDSKRVRGLGEGGGHDCGGRRTLADGGERAKRRGPGVRTRLPSENRRARLPP